jgi:hypothetical protein|tara:strand:- start:287 stop:784 length:498 start_codon:yes stop_codon:yes gene_type:complete
MGVINTELKITSSAAPTGPLSMALNLSTTATITCDDVHQGVLTIASAGSEGILFSGETQGWRSGTFAGAGDAAAGSYGGYVYIKNTSTTSSNNDIYLGIAADDASATDLAAEAAGTDVGDSFAGEIFRWCTIKKGEFLIFPWDYTSRITYDAAGAATLEWWIFDR